MQKITPFLWFDTKAEEAAKYYCSIFKNSKIRQVARYGESGPGKPGSVMTVGFTLDGQEFTAINGGPHFQFTPAISLVVNCKTQEEVDEMWSKLSRGGKKQQCGWLQDKYGISWQIVPVQLVKLLTDKSPGKGQRAMKAMLGMTKIDIKKLEKAAAAKP